ncbi:MAG: hypothetical protein WDZ70_00670, partial [Candidatus Paceibacterota bacterium]
VNITSDGANAVTIEYAETGGSFELTDGTTRLSFADDGSAVLGDDGATTQIDGSLITLSGDTVVVGTVRQDITDNTADALDIQEGSNNYINISTVDGSEAIAFGNAVTNPTVDFLGSGLITLSGNVDATSGLDVTGADFTVGGGFGSTGVTITNAGVIQADGSVTANTLTIAGGSITDSTGSISFGDENLSTTGTLSAGATTLSGALSGTSATFSSTLTATGGITSYTSVTAPHFVATSTTATSTFAGGVQIDTDGFVYDWQTGNVGVGTQSATARLEVDAGNQTPLRLSSDGVGQLELVNTSGETWSIGDGIDASGKLSIREQGRTSDLVFDGTGNIGIGTAVPFNTWGFAPSPGVHIFGSSPALGISDSDGGGKYLLTAHSAQGFHIYNVDDSTERITLANGGNVGIGEIAPGSKLSVSGGATIGASYDTTAAPTNGLLVEGNVGIGTTSPAYTLGIDGTLGVTGATLLEAALTGTTADFSSSVTASHFIADDASATSTFAG